MVITQETRDILKVVFPLVNVELPPDVTGDVYLQKFTEIASAFYKHPNDKESERSELPILNPVQLNVIKCIILCRQDETQDFNKELLKIPGIPHLPTENMLDTISTGIARFFTVLATPFVALFNVIRRGQEGTRAALFGALPTATKEKIPSNKINPPTLIVNAPTVAQPETALEKELKDKALGKNLGPMVQLLNLNTPEKRAHYQADKTATAAEDAAAISIENYKSALQQQINRIKEKASTIRNTPFSAEEIAKINKNAKASAASIYSKMTEEQHTTELTEYLKNIRNDKASKIEQQALIVEQELKQMDKRIYKNDDLRYQVEDAAKLRKIEQELKATIVEPAVIPEPPKAAIPTPVNPTILANQQKQQAIDAILTAIKSARQAKEARNDNKEYKELETKAIEDKKNAIFLVGKAKMKTEGLEAFIDEQSNPTITTPSLITPQHNLSQGNKESGPAHAHASIHPSNKFGP